MLLSFLKNSVVLVVLNIVMYVIARKIRVFNRIQLKEFFVFWREVCINPLRFAWMMVVLCWQPTIGKMLINFVFVFGATFVLLKKSTNIHVKSQMIRYYCRKCDEKRLFKFNIFLVVIGSLLLIADRFWILRWLRLIALILIMIATIEIFYLIIRILIFEKENGITFRTF